MLACFNCMKQVVKEKEDAPGGQEASKESVNDLTSQFKEVALKLKPYPHNIPGSSGSTPAKDFPTTTGSQPAVSSSCSSAQITGQGRPLTFNVDENDGPKEWTALVEPGVHVTFMSLPNGGNDLKRIRFSREFFDKWQAQRWWGENYDRILDLYNVQRFNQQDIESNLARSKDEINSRMDSVSWESPMPIQYHKYSGSGRKENHPYPSEYNGSNGDDIRREKPYCDAALQNIASERDDDPSVFMSNGSEMEGQWVQKDEPGVYITLRQLSDGTRELRGVRFSREQFGEVNAKLWWEQNRERIQEQYL